MLSFYQFTTLAASAALVENISGFSIIATRGEAGFVLLFVFFLLIWAIVILLYKSGHSGPQLFLLRHSYAR